MKKVFISFITSFAFLFPAFAQDSVTANAQNVLGRVVAEVFTPLYQLLTGVAIIYFMYGVARFVYDLNNPDERNTGRSHLLWGTVGLFIILSLGGILPWINKILNGMFSF